MRLKSKQVIINPNADPLIAKSIQQDASLADIFTPEKLATPTFIVKGETRPSPFTQQKPSSVAPSKPNLDKLSVMLPGLPGLVKNRVTDNVAIGIEFPKAFRDRVEDALNNNSLLSSVFKKVTFQDALKLAILYFFPEEEFEEITKEFVENLFVEALSMQIDDKNFVSVTSELHKQQTEIIEMNKEILGYEKKANERNASMRYAKRKIPNDDILAQYNCIGRGKK